MVTQHYHSNILCRPFHILSISWSPMADNLPSLPSSVATVKTDKLHGKTDPLHGKKNDVTLSGHIIASHCNTRGSIKAKIVINMEIYGHPK